MLTHPVPPRGNAHPQAAASLVSNTWDPSIPASTLSSLLGFSVSQLDLLFAHAAPLLREPSLRLLQLDPREDRLQLAFAASVRLTRSSPAVLVEEHSLWRAGKRDGWCEQTYVDSRGDHVREAAFFAAGSEAGARLRWCTRGGQPAVRVLDNGQEIPAEQETLGVLYRANCAMVPLRFYFVFRDGVRRISDNNGPDLQYLARLNGDGARRWQKSGVFRSVQSRADGASARGVPRAPGRGELLHHRYAKKGAGTQMIVSRGSWRRRRCRCRRGSWPGISGFSWNCWRC